MLSLEEDMAKSLQCRIQLHSIFVEVIPPNKSPDRVKSALEGIRS